MIRIFSFPKLASTEDYIVYDYPYMSEQARKSK